VWVGGEVEVVGKKSYNFERIPQHQENRKDKKKKRENQECGYYSVGIKNRWWW